MAATARIDELRHRFAARPRRYFVSLANALRQQGNFDEAVGLLRDQLERNPQHLSGHVVLGQTLFDMGALAESQAAFEAARGLDPGNRVVLRHLGEIASLAGDPAEARMWFGRLRAAEPYADDVAAQLGGASGEPPDIEEMRPEPTVEVDPRAEVIGGAGASGPAVEEPEFADLAEAEAHGSRYASTEPDAAFEPLDFTPVPIDEVNGTREALDPVVGLDLAPAASPSVLDNADRGVLSEPVSGAIPAPDGAGEDTVAPVAGDLFATETMAGLLAAQGHTGQALAIYERLIADRPGDAALQARIDALRVGGPVPDGAESRGEGARPGTSEPEPPRRNPDDSSRGALLARAFADLGRGVPSQSATPEMRGVAAGPENDPFADFSFDRFFVDAERELASQPEVVPPAVPNASDDADAADLARFDAWMRGTS